jgi:hypothetical protein
LNGWVVLAILAVYVLATFRSNHRMGALGNPWIVLQTFVTPSAHLGVIALVAPLPWQWPAPGPRLLAFLQRMVLAFAATEVASVLIVLLDVWFRRMAVLPAPPLRGLILSYLMIVGPAMAVAGGLIAGRANAVEEREAVREEALIARTRLLQSQLHPHVLFNALNGLAELIHKDPPQAEISVMHLADLLRRILKASETPTYALKEERSLVEDYLHIEGLRLGSRLRVLWDWDRDLDDLQIPPLLIQPLVENAIKHGINPQRTGGELLIRAARRNADLALEVWNSGAPYQEGPAGGVGIRNLEARLALHYGLATTFTIGPHKDGTLASMRLPDALLQYAHGIPAGTHC